MDCPTVFAECAKLYSGIKSKISNPSHCVVSKSAAFRIRLMIVE
jgi:hypothetical protein